MPIKPENRALYPPDWKQIRERILARDEHCCRECSAPNLAIGYREDGGKFILVERFGDRKRQAELQKFFGDSIWDRPRLILIVLTIAHLHDPDPANCSDENLAALCQRCHNLLDMPMRQKNAAATRRAKQPTVDMFDQRMQEFRAAAPARDTTNDARIDTIMTGDFDGSR